MCWRTCLTMSFFFGLFQALMPLAGWFCSNRFYQFIESFDHWLAFGLLAFIGIRMIKEGTEKEEHILFNPRKLRVIFTLAIATSIDALAVGISFAFVGMNSISSISYPIVIIGLVSFLLSLIGFMAGCYFGKKVHIRTEILGGIILIGIGIKILIEHLS